jgi:transposase InsO family protein
MTQATVVRRMKAMVLRVKKKSKYKKTTDSNHEYAIAPNLLNQNFRVQTPNQVWVSDITYIRTEVGRVYLIVILDLFSRKVISWQTSYSLEHGFLVVALNLAILRRNPQSSCDFSLRSWCPVCL